MVHRCLDSSIGLSDAGKSVKSPYLYAVYLLLSCVHSTCLLNTCACLHESNTYLFLEELCLLGELNFYQHQIF